MRNSLNDEVKLNYSEPRFVQKLLCTQSLIIETLKTSHAYITSDKVLQFYALTFKKLMSCYLFLRNNDQKAANFMQPTSTENLLTAV
jgi:hypothetical protein